MGGQITRVNRSVLARGPAGAPFGYLVFVVLYIHRPGAVLTHAHVWFIARRCPLTDGCAFTLRVVYRNLQMTLGVARSI